MKAFLILGIATSLDGDSTKPVAAITPANSEKDLRATASMHLAALLPTGEIWGIELKSISITEISPATIIDLARKCLSPAQPPLMDIPKDKNYPPDAVQCSGCGGHGCSICEDKGWLSSGHRSGRTCENAECGRPIPPNHVAVYCSGECASADAN